MKLKAIVIVDEKWGIAKDGKLLTHIPEDLKYFKEKTQGNVVIMGRKTLESLPNGKPLPNRINIILTTKESDGQDIVACRSHEELFKVLESEYSGKEIFVAGGERVYKDLLKYCDGVLVTKMYRDFNADQHFIDLDKNQEFKCFWESDEKEYNGTKYKFTEYRRI